MRAACIGLCRLCCVRFDWTLPVPCRYVVTSLGLFVCSLSDEASSRKFLCASNSGHWMFPSDNKQVFTFLYKLCLPLFLVGAESSWAGGRADSLREVSRAGYLVCFVSQSDFAVAIQDTSSKPSPCKYHWPIIKPLKTNGRMLYLKTQSVPRCKHFSSRLYKPISLCCSGTSRCLFWKTKRRLLYLKTQTVPRCKHFSS